MYGWEPCGKITRISPRCRCCISNTWKQSHLSPSSALYSHSASPSHLSHVSAIMIAYQNDEEKGKPTLETLRFTLELLTVADISALSWMRIRVTKRGLQRVICNNSNTSRWSTLYHAFRGLHSPIRLFDCLHSFNSFSLCKILNSSCRIIMGIQKVQHFQLLSTLEWYWIDCIRDTRALQLKMLRGCFFSISVPYES